MNNAIYKQYMIELREALNEHDPIGLIKIGAPEEEYDYERSLISGPLLRCSTPEEALDLVHKVFCDCFDPETAGPRELYRPLAADLWPLRVLCRSTMADIPPSR